MIAKIGKKSKRLKKNNKWGKRRMESINSQKKSHGIEFSVEISRTVHVLSVFPSNWRVLEDSLYGTFSVVLFFGGCKGAESKHVHHLLFLGVTVWLGAFGRILCELLFSGVGILRFGLRFFAGLLSGPFARLRGLFRRVLRRSLGLRSFCWWVLVL